MDPDFNVSTMRLTTCPRWGRCNATVRCPIEAEIKKLEAEGDHAVVTPGPCARHKTKLTIRPTNAYSDQDKTYYIKVD